MRLTKDTHIAVVMGGLSDEREISLQTGSLVAEALENGGYRRVTRIDMGRDIDVVLRKTRPDVVFNALHGTYGEDGRMQGLLDLLGIPYTGSGVAASAIGMNKILTKMVMRHLAIPVASDVAVVAEEGIAAPLPYPFVFKDPENGSSKGVFIVHEEAEWRAALEKVVGKRMLVEEYVRGREITVAVLCGEVLGDVEIVPAKKFYDYEAKYFDEHTRYVPDPGYDPGMREAMWRHALDLHRALGCRGVTRSDFIVASDRFVMLEINTLPGMTSHSLVPMAAARRGISYLALIERLLTEALEG